jgi:hypothetical protein
MDRTPGVARRGARFLLSFFFVAGSSLAGGVASTACGGAQPAPPAAERPGVSSAQEGADAGATLTAAQCAAAGGEVIGDIGDGAIHSPDFRCPGSGERPLGPIAPEAGQPMAVEGAVCCR